MKKKLFQWLWSKKLEGAKIIRILNWRSALVVHPCGNRAFVCYYWFPWEE